MTRPKLRWALRVATMGLIVPLLFVGIRWGSGNFGAVESGRLYRSAQPSAAFLLSAIRTRRIRTVLNLRGSNPDELWYTKERKTTLAEGATLVDFPMSSDQWLSREQARELIDLLDRCDYPLLVHCEWGAERTGLVSALARLLRPGSTLEDGLKEFSTYYLFLPIKDGIVMRGHILAYGKWLSEQNRRHSPDTLRLWLTRDYRPGSPSREHWECNPYPLKIVSRPQRPAVTLWGQNPCKVTR